MVNIMLSKWDFLSKGYRIMRKEGENADFLTQTIAKDEKTKSEFFAVRG